jgi:hypothetical protein
LQGLVTQPMTVKSAPQPVAHRGVPAENRLREIFRELSENGSDDLGLILRGVADALQIVSTTLPDGTKASREVWNHQKRDDHRSRVTWESWLLRQKLSSLRDKR